MTIAQLGGTRFRLNSEAQDFDYIRCQARLVPEEEEEANDTSSREPI